VTRHCFAIVLITTALALGLTEPRPCFGKDTEKPKHGPRSVVVLNVSRLFKESKQFTTAMEKMKAEVVKAEENVKKQHDKLKSQREEMEKLPIASDERMKQEEQISKVEAALAASVSFQKGVFLRQEAGIYLSFYRRIDAEVEAYANKNNIDLVLRTNDQTALDASKPDSVLQYINRPVVWSSADADITSIIAERIASHGDSLEGDGKSGE
jgi:Skp family chaperone for outer membrane proteins